MKKVLKSYLLKNEKTLEEVIKGLHESNYFGFYSNAEVGYFYLLNDKNFWANAKECHKTYEVDFKSSLLFSEKFDKSKKYVRMTEDFEFISATEEEKKEHYISILDSVIDDILDLLNNSNDYNFHFVKADAWQEYVTDVNFLKLLK